MKLAPTEVVEVLHVQGLVEALDRGDLGYELRSGVLPEDCHCRAAARQKPEEQKQDH
jgi:hypothetical protein